MKIKRTIKYRLKPLSFSLRYVVSRSMPEKQMNLRDAFSKMHKLDDHHVTEFLINAVGHVARHGEREIVHITAIRQFYITKRLTSYHVSLHRERRQALFDVRTFRVMFIPSLGYTLQQLQLNDDKTKLVDSER